MIEFTISHYRCFLYMLIMCLWFYFSSQWCIWFIEIILIILFLITGWFSYFKITIASWKIPLHRLSDHSISMVLERPVFYQSFLLITCYRIIPKYEKSNEQRSWRNTLIHLTILLRASPACNSVYFSLARIIKNQMQLTELIWTDKINGIS